MSLLPRWALSGQAGATPEPARLLGFLVRGVLAAGIAELRELESASGGLLVLGGRIVPVLALGALQSDNLAHLSKSPSNVADRIDRQAA